MKTALLIAATLGLSASAAMAQCASSKVTASVDTEITTASIVTTEQSKPAQSAAPTDEIPSEQN